MLREMRFQAVFLKFVYTKCAGEKAAAIMLCSVCTSQASLRSVFSKRMAEAVFGARISRLTLIDHYILIYLNNIIAYGCCVQTIIIIKQMFCQT